MAFDPDAYLASKDAVAFDPDAYLRSKGDGLKQIEQNGPGSYTNPVDEFIVKALQKNPQLADRLEKAAGQGSPFGRVVQGMADLPVGAMQFGLNVAGKYPEAANTEIAAIRNRTEALRGPDAGSTDWWRLLGNVANPIPWKAASAIPAAATTTGRIGQAGMLASLLGGPGTPVTSGDYFDEVGKNAAISGVTGAAIPAAIEVGRTAGNLARNVFGPMTQKGAESAAGRVALEVAGNKADDVIANLQTAPRTVNAGQAAVPAGSAEFSALQRIADQVNPSEAVALKAAQSARRDAALGRIAKDDAAMKSATSLRSAVTEPMYEAAKGYKGPVNVVPVVDKIDDLLKKNPGNREMVTELDNLKRGVTAAARDFGFGPSFTNADAQKFSSAIDGVKASLSKRENSFIKKELVQLKQMMVDLIPDYGKAQQEFARLSAPINRMEVGRELQNKLTTAVTERPGIYLNALKESSQILKNAIGDNRFGDVAEVLTPREMKIARSVANQLENELKLKTMAAAGMKKTQSIVSAAGDTTPQVNLLNRTVTAINAVMRRIESGASERTTQELANLMADPRKMAKIMVNAKPAERSAIIDGLVKMQAAGVGATSGNVE